MYENPGKKLKTIVSTIVGIEMVASVLLWVIIWVSMIAQNGEEAAIAGFLVGGIVACIGCFLAWVSGLVMATFADIAENIYEINKKLGGTSDGNVCKPVSVGETQMNHVT